MNSEREKADILFNYGLPLQFCCHLIQFYTVLSLRTATLKHNISFESRKGVITIQRCSVENQKGISLYRVYGNSALLVLSRTLLNIVKALLVLNRRCTRVYNDNIFL